jgi:hypothetical protein
MFKLNEEKLLKAFRDPDEETWVKPFDPYKVDADELNRVVDSAIEAGVIEREDSSTTIAIYPLSISEPQPLLCVNPGKGGALLLGGPVDFDFNEEELFKASTKVLRQLVSDANALYGESEQAHRTEHVPYGSGQLTDRQALDRLAEVLNGWSQQGDGSWTGGDLVEVVAELVARSGRQLLDSAAD